MDGTAIKAMMAEIAPVIREFVAEELAREVAPLREENVAFRARIVTLEEAGASAPEIDLTGVEKLIEAEIAKIPPPEPAQSVGMEEVAAMVTEAVSALPAAKDGVSVTVEDVAPLIADEVAKATDPRDINKMVVAEVARAVASVPVPQDGKDAANIVEALKDRGELVLTLQDGRLIRTGIRDGKDGEPGKPGRDGFSLDDFDVDKGEDGRTYILKFEQGDTRHEYELTFPVPVYCGVYKEADSYVPGDMVTWGGSLWHCDAETKDKPGTDAWTLAVKKGRDGKDVRNG